MPKGRVGTAVRQAKERTVAEVAARLREAPATVLVDFRGLDVAEDAELRRRLRAARVEYRVVKNTLAARAAEQVGVRGLEALLRGPTAVAFSLEDPTAAARELVAFARDHEELQVKGGVLDGRVIGPEEVKALAELPPKEVLLTRAAAALAGPLRAAAAVLAAPLRALVTATDQLAKRGRAEPA
jgi:large subunit ribosomal protein L10